MSENQKFRKVGATPASIRVTTLISTLSAVSIIVAGTWAIKDTVDSIGTQLTLMNLRLTTIETKLSVRYTDNSSIDLFNGDFYAR